MNEAERRASDYAPRPKLEPWQTALIWGFASYFVTIFFDIFTLIGAIILGTPSLSDLFAKYSSYDTDDAAHAVLVTAGIMGFGYNKWQMKNHLKACDRELEELENQHAHDQE